MTTITLRNLPPRVASRIEQKAKEDKTSLNKTVVGLLEEVTGILKKKKKTLSHDLDRLAGLWTRQEASCFESALAKQRQIDPNLWK